MSQVPPTEAKPEVSQDPQVICKHFLVSGALARVPADYLLIDTPQSF